MTFCSCSRSIYWCCRILLQIYFLFPRVGRLLEAGFLPRGIHCDFSFHGEPLILIVYRILLSNVFFLENATSQISSSPQFYIYKMIIWRVNLIFLSGGCALHNYLLCFLKPINKFSLPHFYSNPQPADAAVLYNPSSSSCFLSFSISHSFFFSSFHPFLLP